MPYNSILATHIANRMLNAHFQKTANKQDMQLEEVEKFIREEACANPVGWGKLLFRIIHRKANRALVALTIRALPDEQQRFLQLKYGEKAFVTKQAKVLNVSSSQLYLWHRVIIERILHSLRFRLTVEDVFLRTKIIEMQGVIEMLIAARKEYDPHFRVVDAAYYRSLVRYNEQYGRLLYELDSCINRGDCRLDIAVAAMVENPYEYHTTAAQKYGLHPGSYGRYIHSFEDRVRGLVF